jgi:signal peptidase II
VTRFLAVSGAIILLDQFTKAVILATLPLYDSYSVISGLFDFTHVRNTGVAFGMLNESVMPYKTVVTASMALVALAGIGFYARRLQAHETRARIGLALILGGALGNLLDRVRWGYVVDFMDVYWRNWHFWAFNVADAAITAGAGLVFLDLLMGNRHASRTV